MRFWFPVLFVLASVLFGFSGVGSISGTDIHEPRPLPENKGDGVHARFYDANLGRFHILDEYEGRTGEPLSLHKYLSAHANPVTGWDPSGRMSISLPGISATTAIIGSLALMAMPSVRQASHASSGLLNAVINTIGDGIHSAQTAALALAVALSRDLIATLDKIRAQTDDLIGSIRPRCNGGLWFHYTSAEGALGITASSSIISSSGFGSAFPPGAYATTVVPGDPRFTKRTLSMAFWNRPIPRKVEYFVAFCSNRFRLAPGRGIVGIVPHYYAPTRSAGVHVPVDIKLVFWNPMR